MGAKERNNIQIAGPEGAPAVVFAHGFGCDQAMWRYVAPRFQDRFQVVLYDHIGFGGSDLAAWDPDRHGSLAGYAADLVEILDELALGPVVFVGHSVSSMIGVLAAIDRPELFERLVLVCPSPRYIDDLDDGYVGGFTSEQIDGLLQTLDANYLGWSGAMAPVVMGNADRPELGAELTASFCRTDPEVARSFAGLTFLSDSRTELPRVSRPTLVLQCRDDAIAPVEVGTYVAEQIPDASLVLLDATGHCPNLSAPGKTSAAIAEFVADLA